ncbi:MAG TPA: quinone oxidoreductase [Burkholderiales bacterium]|nr:quinone oxidoreductase [Burkholderiales bacterium]
MAKAIRIQQPGGPEVLQFEDIEVGAPGEGQARIRHTAIGVNYIDTYHRTGTYPLPLPTGIGLEGAGVIEALGPGVADLAVGDRVAYAGGPVGAYATERVMPADRLVKIPDGVSDQQAAGMMLKGMTAEYLIRRTFKVKAGDTVLWHAAAGGVGLIACQWLKALGAHVIGTVSSDEKAALAKAHGCEYPIVYTREDLVARVKEITGGKGVPVVYDSVGKDTYLRSLDCLRPRGMMVLFGASSGPVPPLDSQVLAQKGSLFLTRPTLFSYTATREDLVLSATSLFEVVRSGQVKIEVTHTYPLADAQQAHRDLEGRKTTGSLLLVP